MPWRLIEPNPTDRPITGRDWLIVLTALAVQAALSLLLLRSGY